jgi:hypothetical protein
MEKNCNGQKMAHFKPEESEKLTEMILYFCFEDRNKSKITSEITPPFLKPNLQEKPI